VDDSSTDNTDAVLAEYIAKDPRFKYFHRPDTHLPGGNGARNYGFLQCKGECIQWFDSDDLMHPEKLEKKVQSFKTQKVDLVVSKSEYFNSDKESYPYNFTTENINFESFSMGNVTWITNDFMIRREIALQTTFNENLRAGQEYNYVCKALLLTDKVFFINDFLTKRRKGVESIGNNRVKSKKKYLETRFMSYWLTCKDVSTMVNHSEYQKFSLLTCVSCYLRSGNSIVLPQGFVEELKKVF
jgi:glycosyltransferase involved in cell wall biosynthesis